MPPKRKVTVREVAAHAGVSAATVSLVLNQKGSFSAATLTRVLEAASALGFTNRRSRGPRSEPKTIRFLKISMHGNTINRDHSHFISDYIDGMSAEALRRGYTLQIESHEGATASSIAQSLSGTTTRAVIVLGTELSQEDVILIQGTGVLCVFVDTFFEFIDANFVDMNNADAVFMGVERFRQLGLSRIGFVGSYVETRNFALRAEAFKQSMARLGLKVAKDAMLMVGSTVQTAYRDSVSALQQKELYEAYFCANDVIAFGFMRALKEFGKRIPDDVAVIGFDNLPMSASMEPALTTIDVSKRQIGALAISLLDDMIKRGSSVPAVKALVGANLVLRESETKHSFPLRGNALTSGLGEK